MEKDSKFMKIIWKQMMMLQNGMHYGFVILILLLVDLSEGSRRLNMETQNFEAQKHLNQLNKSPVKTIKSPDGDTIDCVHMSHQPAFDHPLLKNHTIQMRPSYHPEGVFGMTKVSNLKSDAKPSTQLWHLNGRCPEGTIPIRRVKKEDLLRASSIERFGKKRHKSFPKPTSAAPDLTTQTGHQHAIAYVEGGRYFGTKATINVWQPEIQQPIEFSLSQIWLLACSFNSDLNSIEAGWQVSPDLYGDNNTRLFTYWTSDAYQATGCYNLFCSGFIQINNDSPWGQHLPHLWL